MITASAPIDADALRIRHEFLTLPGLRASVASFAALLSVSPRQARRVLDSLVDEGFLERGAGDQYARRVPAVGDQYARPASAADGQDARG
jgi:DNA-binding IclR family transcriptional regulator